MKKKKEEPTGQMNFLTAPVRPLKPVKAGGPVRNDYELRYRIWKQENPQVFALYVKFALEAKERGRKFSIGMITERIRWEVRMSWEKDAMGFKVNNNHLAYIARDLVQMFPDIEALIEMRSVIGEASWNAAAEAGES